MWLFLVILCVLVGLGAANVFADEKEYRMAVFIFAIVITLATCVFVLTDAENTVIYSETYKVTSRIENTSINGVLVKSDTIYTFTKKEKK